MCSLFILTRFVCTGVDSDRVCNDDTIEESDFHDNEFKEDFDELRYNLKKCERYLWPEYVNNTYESKRAIKSK